MVYHNTVQKYKSTSVNEYNQAEKNKITTRNQTEQEQSNMESVEFMVDYKKKEIKVTFEIPKTSNEKAAREFEARLKELYLKKVKVLSIQERESALSSITTRDKEENFHE